MRRPKPCHDKALIRKLVGNDRKINFLLLYDLEKDWTNTEFFTFGDTSGLLAIWHESLTKAYAYLLADNKNDLSYALRFLTARDKRTVCFVRTDSDDIEEVLLKGQKTYHVNLSKGEERPHFPRKAQRLGVKHIDCVGKILATSGKEPDTISGIIKSLESGLHFGYLEDGALCSYARISVQYDGSAMMDNVYTVPGCRRRGMAQATVETLIGHVFYKEGLDDVHAFVGSSNHAAIGLYNKLGFKKLAELTRVVI